MGLFNRGQKSTKSVIKSVKLVHAAGPATSLEKISTSGSSLVKPAQAATSSLTKRGLMGMRADAILVLDHSGSMHKDYKDGNVQKLVERALAFALQFDDEIEVIPFDTHVRAEVKVTLSNYQGVVNREIFEASTMGSTNMLDAFGEVKRRAEKATQPIIVLFVTDGDPNPGTSRRVQDLVCELAGYPVFIKFLALYSVPFLQTLDDLGPDQRLLDNVDAKFYPSGVDNVADEDFAEAMVEELDTWEAAAKTAGVLTT